MTLPNSFDNTKRKLETLWRETESNRNVISNRELTQTEIRKELNKTVVSQHNFSKFSFQNTEWATLDIFDTDEDDGTISAYKSWNIRFQGLNYEDVANVRHNFLLRFGSGEPLLSENISDDTNIWTNFNVHVDDQDPDNPIFDFHFGIYLTNNDGIEEMDSFGLQVKVQVLLMNSNLYF